MASTVVGRSGRTYVQGEMLQRHRQDPRLSIFKAESGNESFVLKRVSRPFYDLSLRLATEFPGSRRLRLHTDCNQEECLLVYPYFKSTLLALIQEDPDIFVAERRKVLRHAGEAIQELHSKGWIHLDIKPDNILVDWIFDGEGNRIITDAVLGDFDIAFEAKDGKPRYTPFAIGNAMWRSPEGQTGRGMTKASDVFSYGLVCIYALGGGSLLLLEDFKELAKNGIKPEQEVLVRHFCYFGPAPKGLLDLVDEEKWCAALKAASEFAEYAVKDQPELRFQQWGSELGPDAVGMISGMTQPDPSARTTIDRVLTSRWWQEAV